MRPILRPYRQASDFERVGSFLVRTYRTEGSHVNWLQPRWEYMHFHPYVRNVDLSAIGLWEIDGRIVGVVHPELAMGRAYFELELDCQDDLWWDMLHYAEEHLAVASEDGRALSIYVSDADELEHETAVDLGYAATGGVEPMACRSLTEPVPEAPVPVGFLVQSLADDNDLRKVHRMLWRGFDHGDDPPEDGLEERRFMQSAPSFRPDLNIVAVAPDGEFVSYGGIWFEPARRIAYVEPVATDPCYRRMGLGRAVVSEGLRRCAKLGATVAYVGSTLPLYVSLGFREVYRYSLWRRQWTAD